MTEVSRQSTFPPILKSYNPAITASFNPSGSPSPAKSSRKADQQAQEARPQAVPAQSKEQRSGKKKGDRGTINQKTGSSSGLLTADKIRREHELELRRKRNQASYDDRLTVFVKVHGHV